MTTSEKILHFWCCACWAIIGVAVIYGIVTEPGLGGYARIALEMIGGSS